MSAPLAALWNGRAVAEVPATSRALHYGDGVFRTLLLRNGRIDAIERQLAALARDAGRLDLRPPEASLLHADLAAITALGDATVKLLLVRAGTQRGYRPERDDADRLLLVYPPPSPAPAAALAGIDAIRSPVMLAAQPLLAGVKHLNRLEQVLASRHWPADTDEAILVDDRGAPICGTRSNLFWVRDGVLQTPALDRCGVAGVTRERVIAEAEALGLPCRVASQPWAALLAADEAFVCGSLIGLRPLRMLDRHRYPAERPVTRRLQQRIAHTDHPCLESVR